MSELPPIDPDDIPDFPDGPPGTPPPSALPGLGQFLVERYTSNVCVSEQLPVLDLLTDTIHTASRMFMTQGPDGKIRFHNHKPADYALGASAFPIGDTVIDVDDVSPWQDSIASYLLIDPHTNDSEIRTVTDANYPTSQNSVTLTSSDGTAFTILGFSGCDGNSTPATAKITVNSFTSGTPYTVTLDGFAVAFTPSSGDTEETIAAFIAGTLRSHPAINRRFAISWVSGDDFVDITARFGTLTLNEALTYAHVAPVADPPTGGALTATASGSLAAGFYRVSYTEKNEHGETLLSPYKQVTLAANEKITVPSVTPSVAGNTICWYVSTEPNTETRIRFLLENDGSGHVINSLPLLTAALPPDLNRTGTEVMRVRAVFSDREESRSAIGAANVLKGSFSWQLGNRKSTVNQIEMKIRNAADDWRLVEIRERNDAHIAKTRKVSKKTVNGQAIDNLFQGYRIATGLLAYHRDADFYYKWSATRGAGLLEEGDVVCITDDGSGVYNFPVYIEEIEVDISGAGMPKYKFTGVKYASTLFDDSVRDVQTPIITD